jgi:predicted RecB family nuclease
MVPVQFSCHRTTPDGLVHHAWLAEGPGDPSVPFALALIEACADAETILVYSAGFEKARIDSLITRVPSLRSSLEAINQRIVDLLPIVRENVYHPDFNGSFSIKKVLPALIPGMGYEDLDIQGGSSAAAALETLLFDTTMEPAARVSLREQLLDYCERDTLAMVRLLERLKSLLAAN